MTSALATLTVGQTLGPLVRGPITTRQLVEYAGASLDWNRIHYDDPFARAGGHPSVIAHGMLSMAFLGQLTAELAGGPKHIVALSARFKAIAYPADTIRVTGTVAAIREEAGSRKIELALRAERLDATGAATVIIDGAATIAT